MRLPNITGFFQAAAGNYQPGRGRAIRCFTVHHSAGWEQTLRYLWADPARGASSNFYVSGSVREQYVDTDDTPYTNGNFSSNQESLTCEVRGDWRGYYDQATLDNLTEVMYQCLKIWPGLVLTFHKDVTSSSTLCPADLKDKGYAAQCWNNAKARIAAEATPTPVPPSPTAPIEYTRITPKRIRLVRTANLWNFNFASWASAQAVKVYGANELIDVVATARNSLGGVYYMTAYSYNEGNIRSTNGFNVVDCEDYVPAPTEPTPPPAPTWQSMENPRKMRAQVDLRVYDLTTKTEVGSVIPAGTDIDLVDIITDTDGKVYLRSKYSHDAGKNWGILANKVADIPAAPVPDPEPIPPKPIDTDPTTPGAGDVETRLTSLEKLVKYIVDFLKGIFSGFKP
jgi:hypothetical protein